MIRAMTCLASAFLTVLLISACANTELAQRPPPGYVGDVASRVSAVNWEQARPVTVRLDEYAFQPDRLSFDRGTPYRLSLENVGKKAHTFTSEGFFKAVAARRVTTPQNVVDTPALVNLVVPAGETYVVEFVPVQAGTYPLTCEEPLHTTFGMSGTIAVR